MSFMGIKIDKVSKVFKINGIALSVLENIDIDFTQGEIVSIVGKSGCGKSTLLRIIAGLEPASEGFVEVDGRIMTRPSEKDVGIIFQESRLLPWTSVEKNIEFGLSSPHPKNKKDIIQEHVDLVGLSGFEKALPKQLSGGMQQRVSIARSLINRPSTLLLDEPFGALDAFTKINMQEEILRIWEREKTTMILVTHDIDEAVYMGDIVVVMSERPGKIEKIIPIDLSRPRDRTSDNYDYFRKLVYREFFRGGDSLLEYAI
jgi:sulfonate transport system ATP-binding protein